MARAHRAHSAQVETRAASEFRREGTSARATAYLTFDEMSGITRTPSPRDSTSVLAAEPKRDAGADAASGLVEGRAILERTFSRTRLPASQRSSRETAARADAQLAGAPRSYARPRPSPGLQASDFRTGRRFGRRRPFDERRSIRRQFAQLNFAGTRPEVRAPAGLRRRRVAAGEFALDEGEMLAARAATAALWAVKRRSSSRRREVARSMANSPGHSERVGRIRERLREFHARKSPATSTGRAFQTASAAAKSGRRIR